MPYDKDSDGGNLNHAMDLRPGSKTREVVPLVRIAGHIDEMAQGDKLPKIALPVFLEALVAKMVYDGVSTVIPVVYTNDGYTAEMSLDLSAFAKLDSPDFIGDPTAPTPAITDNDTSVATTAYVAGSRLQMSRTAVNKVQFTDPVTGDVEVIESFPEDLHVEGAAISLDVNTEKNLIQFFLNDGDNVADFSVNIGYLKTLPNQDIEITIGEQTVVVTANYIDEIHWEVPNSVSYPATLSTMWGDNSNIPYWLTTMDSSGNIILAHSTTDSSCYLQLAEIKNGELVLSLTSRRLDVPNHGLALGQVHFLSADVPGTVMGTQGHVKQPAFMALDADTLHFLYEYNSKGVDPYEGLFPVKFVPIEGQPTTISFTGGTTDHLWELDSGQTHTGEFWTNIPNSSGTVYLEPSALYSGNFTGVQSIDWTAVPPALALWKLYFAYVTEDFQADALAPTSSANVTGVTRVSWYSANSTTLDFGHLPALERLISSYSYLGTLTNISKTVVYVKVRAHTADLSNCPNLTYVKLDRTGFAGVVDLTGSSHAGLDVDITLAVGNEEAAQQAVNSGALNGKLRKAGLILASTSHCANIQTLISRGWVIYAVAPASTC